MRLRLARGAALFVVDGAPAIFSEEAQMLFRLSEVEGLLARRLAESASCDDLVAKLAERDGDRASASAFLLDRLELWSRQGLIEASPDAAERPPVETVDLDLAGRTVRVSFFDGRIRDLVAPTIRHLALPVSGPASDIDLAYVVGRIADRVVVAARDGRCLLVSDDEAAPALRARLLDDLLSDLGDGVALHAALLVKDNRVLLLCGSPGSGKTTLSTALVEAGFLYGSDDVVVADSGGRVRGAAFAPALKRGSWRLLRDHRGDMSAPLHRRLDGRLVRYLAPGRLAPAIPQSPTEVVLLRRDRRSPAALLPASAVEVLSVLVAGAHTTTGALTTRQLSGLVALVDRATCAEIRFSDLNAGVMALAGRRG